jgi:hypothetical protein
MSENPKEEKTVAGAQKLKGKRGRKKKVRGISQMQAVPYSAGIKEIEVTILKSSMTAFENEATSQSRGTRFGKITAADVVSTVAFAMGDGPTIDKEKVARVTVKLVIPVAALNQLEAAAKRNEVGIDQIIDELGQSLEAGTKKKSRLDGKNAS